MLSATMTVDWTSETGAEEPKPKWEHITTLIESLSVRVIDQKPTATTYIIKAEARAGLGQPQHRSGAGGPLWLPGWLPWTVSSERLCKQLLPFWFHNWSHILALHLRVTQLIQKTWMLKMNSRVHLQIKLPEDLRPLLRMLWVRCGWTRSAPLCPTIPRALSVSESAVCKDENRN